MTVPIGHSKALRRSDIACATLSAGLLLTLLVAVYGALVPFFAALLATPLILLTLGVGAYRPAREPRHRRTAEPTVAAQRAGL
jgi:CHASE2 domain-containing sensor protein